MHILLQTHDVWCIEGSFSPCEFVDATQHLLQPNDIIAFGAYEPTENIVTTLDQMGAAQNDASLIYSTFFEFNREEHPHGRAFEISVSYEKTAMLSELCTRNDGQKDKPLFFDHVLAYRHGTPLLPLFCFHDAFNGGELCVSGLYTESIIRIFARALNATYASVFNDEFKVSS